MNTLHVINLMTYINEHVLMAFLENELEACQKSVDTQFSSSIFVMLNFIKCFIFIGMVRIFVMKLIMTTTLNLQKTTLI